MWITYVTVQHEILVLSHKPHSITFFHSTQEIKKQRTVSQKRTVVVENITTCLFCNSRRVIVTNIDIFSILVSVVGRTCVDKVISVGGSSTGTDKKRYGGISFEHENPKLNGYQNQYNQASIFLTDTSPNK